MRYIGEDRDTDAIKIFTYYKYQIQIYEARKHDDNHSGGIAALLLCEVVNALRYKPDFDYKKLIKAIGNLYKLHIHIEPITEDLLIKGAEIAFEGDVTIYDAMALAELFKTFCITADEKTQYKKS